MAAINPKQNFINPSTWSPSGRIGRQRYIATSLILCIVGFVVGFMIGFSGHQELAPVLLLIVGVPCVFANIKRCRDAGISPHWTWVTLIPYAGLVLFIFLCFRGSEPIPSVDEQSI